MNQGDNQFDKHQIANHYMDSAVRQLRRGRPALALEILARAVDLEIIVKDLEFIRALCLCQLDHLFEAQKALERELEEFPQNEVARSLLEAVVQDCQQVRSQLASGSNASSQEEQKTADPVQPLAKQIEKAIKAPDKKGGSQFRSLLSTQWITDNINRVR